MNDCKENQDSRRANQVIDIFLDGSLVESERDLIEKHCLEDRRFFAWVRSREELRAQLAAMARDHP